MPIRIKTLAAVSVGAVALASTAYAVGSTTGNGFALAATAAQTSATDPWTETLAGKLGVEPSKLADALATSRQDPQPGGDPRNDELTALADALGVSKADLQTALDKLRPSPPGKPGQLRHDDIAAALAKKLGIDESKVQAALEKLRGNGPGLLDIAALAKELGVDESKLKDAFDSVRPRAPRQPGFTPGPPGLGGPPELGGRTAGPHGGGPGGIPDAFAAELAKALGIDESTVKAAFDKLSTQHQQQAQTRHDAFVKALADKLGLSVEKVQQGLGSVPPRGFEGPGHP